MLPFVIYEWQHKVFSSLVFETNSEGLMVGFTKLPVRVWKDLPAILLKCTT
jgi:hypothetical protein